MNDDLLIKYIIGTSSKDEAKAIENWIGTSEANNIYYNDFLKVWQHNRNKSENTEINVNEAWQRFLNYRDRETATTAPKRSVKLKAWGTTMAAAAVLLITLTTYFFISNRQIAYFSKDEVASMTLPDNSTIVLNKASSLHYTKRFNKNERSVNLSGEAFFDVTKDKYKPFKVVVDDIEVVVVGTSFNIRSSEELTEVVVESGIVKVLEKNKNYTLYPNDKLIVDKKTKSISISRTKSILYQYYRTNIFICDHTPLSEIAKELSLAYDVTIQIDNELLKNQPLSNKFSKDEPIENILKIIAETMNAQVQKRGNIYSIR